MGKPPAGMLVVGITIIACVAVLWVHASNASHPQAAGITPNHASPTPQPTEAGHAVRRKPGARPRARPTPQGKRNRGIPPKLKRQVRAFLTDAYLLKPDESPTERRERLSPYLGPILALGALNAIEGEIRSNKSSQKRREAQSLTIKGLPSIAKATMQPDHGRKSVLTVRAPVTVVTANADDTVLNRHVSNSVSKWQRVGSDWFVIDFTL
jgi:hypothetical protein